jgi:hypothetical protein
MLSGVGHNELQYTRRLSKVYPRPLTIRISTGLVKLSVIL